MNNPTAPPLQSIYPVLEGPQDDQVLVATEQKTHRLQHISRLQRQLEEERDLRAALYKKYHRGVNVLDGIDTTLITVSMGLGVGGVGLLSTVVAAPVVLGLEAGSLACGILAVAGKYVGRRLATKAKKHDEIRVLANCKLNTVADHVSTALKDGEISDREFRLVLDELAKYYGMRDEIRAGARKAHATVALDTATKNELLQRGRTEAACHSCENTRMDIKPILLTPPTRVYVTPMRLKKSPTSEPAAIKIYNVQR